jgi:uncharacterized protein YjiS (DUF1127 family)
MTVLTLTLARAKAHTPSDVAASCARAFDALRKDLVRRRGIRELRSLEDRMLKDIGVHRSEIEAAARGLDPRGVR